VSLPAGKDVFHRGDPGDSMYVVLRGAVEISFKNDTGEKIVLGHTIKAGGGIDDGEKVLDIVASHPATALIP
jgi:CRP-like cAMP-binding protein